MTKDAFEALVKIRKLHEETSDSEEIKSLVASGKVRLIDAENSALSIESRFDLAYNAAHALALAALRQKGYRSSTRYLVFQCLEQTLEFLLSNGVYWTARIEKETMQNTKVCLMLAKIW